MLFIELLPFFITRFFIEPFLLRLLRLVTLVGRPLYSLNPRLLGDAWDDAAEVPAKGGAGASGTRPFLGAIGTCLAADPLPSRRADNECCCGCCEACGFIMIGIAADAVADDNAIDDNAPPPFASTSMLRRRSCSEY